MVVFPCLSEALRSLDLKRGEPDAPLPPRGAPTLTMWAVVVSIPCDTSQRNLLFIANCDRDEVSKRNCNDHITRREHYRSVGLLAQNNNCISADFLRFLFQKQDPVVLVTSLESKPDFAQLYVRAIGKVHPIHRNNVPLYERS